MITFERLHELLNYDPRTGLWTWIKRSSPYAQSITIGGIAGCPNKEGYWHIRIDRRLYKASRLAWLYMTGEWPECDIDHEDTDPGNNIWSNLRLATDSQNNANRRSYCISGLKGVYLHKKTGKWQASIKKGKNIYLGLYATPEEAHEAYCKAAVKYYGSFARTA